MAQDIEATVRSETRSGPTARHHGTIFHEVEGTFDQVTAKIEEILRDTRGYGCSFSWPPGKSKYRPPKDLGDGRWIAYGDQSTSCD